METIDLVRMFFALVAVLGMIGGLAFLARKTGLAKNLQAQARNKRLAVVESLPLDQRRRVAIIRCDDREHLVVLNANSVSVIERAFNQPVSPGKEASAPQEGASAEPAAAQAAAPAPALLAAPTQFAPDEDENPVARMLNAIRRAAPSLAVKLRRKSSPNKQEAA